MSKDALLQQAVMDELEWEPRVTAAHIGVTAREGVVTLTGHVPTFWEKQAAEAAAARVKGVKAVVDEIAVELLGNPVSDERLAEQSLAILAHDSSLPQDAVHVKVDKGHVTLMGEVEWQFQREAAERDIHTLAGVAWISNKITIKPSSVVEQVKEKIHKALDRVAPFEADTISVVAKGGTVTLSGIVDTAYERDLVEDAAWSVPGVVQVNDDLEIAW
jgi:osmotically-inducible protein OsmY